MPFLNGGGGYLGDFDMMEEADDDDSLMLPLPEKARDFWGSSRINEEDNISTASGTTASTAAAGRTPSPSSSAASAAPPAAEVPTGFLDLLGGAGRLSTEGLGPLPVDNLLMEAMNAADIPLFKMEAVEEVANGDKYLSPARDVPALEAALPLESIKAEASPSLSSPSASTTSTPPQPAEESRPPRKMQASVRQPRLKFHLLVVGGMNLNDKLKDLKGFTELKFRGERLKELNAQVEAEFGKGKDINSLPIVFPDGSHVDESKFLSEFCRDDGFNSGRDCKIKCRVGSTGIEIVDIVDYDCFTPFYGPRDNPHPASNPKNKPIMVESMSFEEFRLINGMGEFSRHWEWTQVNYWLRWATGIWPEVRPNFRKFRNLRGRDVGDMSRPMLEMKLLCKVEEPVMDEFWRHTEFLYKRDIALVPERMEMVDEPEPVELRRMGEYELLQDIAVPTPSSFAVPSPSPNQQAGPKPTDGKKNKIVLGRYQEGRVLLNLSENSQPRSGNNGNAVQLWRFMLDLLTDYSKRDIIRWNVDLMSNEGEFTMHKPEEVARLWGECKGRPNMNYEKLGRALRYYYGGSILDKVVSKRFTYRFVCNLKDLLGFSPRELAVRMQQQYEKSAYYKSGIKL